MATSSMMLQSLYRDMCEYLTQRDQRKDGIVLYVAYKRDGKTHSYAALNLALAILYGLPMPWIPRGVSTTRRDSIMKYDDGVFSTDALRCYYTVSAGGKGMSLCPYNLEDTVDDGAWAQQIQSLGEMRSAWADRFYLEPPKVGEECEWESLDDDDFPPLETLVDDE